MKRKAKWLLSVILCIAIVALTLSITPVHSLAAGDIVTITPVYISTHTTVQSTNITDNPKEVYSHIDAGSIDGKLPVPMLLIFFEYNQ